MASFKICGPKLSICGLLLSIWGVLQIGIMSLMFYVKSVAFVEDLPLANETYPDADSYRKALDDSYGNVALSCLVAALCYVLTLLVSAHQVWVNNKSSGSSGGVGNGVRSTRNNYANFQNES